MLPNELESVKLNYGADGRAVYGHVITKFSGMGRFTYPWCSPGALRARSPAAIMVIEGASETRPPPPPVA